MDTSPRIDEDGYVDSCIERRQYVAMKLIQTIDAECCPQVLASPLAEDEAERLASALRVLADPARLRLLSLIGAHPQGEACVCELTAPLALSQPTVSHHLKVLAQAGLVGREQRGRWVFYWVLPEPIELLRGALARPIEASTAWKEGRMNELREHVRDRYAIAARAVEDGCAANDFGEEAGCFEPGQGLGVILYDKAQRGEVPEDAVLASLGCGNPTMVADLREGETVLDLGSGGGIDVLLSARRVGPTGKAYGLDMTDEMLELARANAAKAGATNVEFVKGYIEDIPLPDASVDVVISNCVINLSTDKSKVITEMFRVLRPGGRLGISDVIAADGLTTEERATRGSYVGCIAGALSLSEYGDELTRAGFGDISIDLTHELADEIYGANVRASRT